MMGRYMTAPTHAMRTVLAAAAFVVSWRCCLVSALATQKSLETGARGALPAACSHRRYSFSELTAEAKNNRAFQHKSFGHNNNFDALHAVRRSSVQQHQLQGDFATPALYQHDGWRLSYRHQICETNQMPTLLLIHPVGIGLSSWFWTKFASVWKKGTLFAPDLIGCGDLDLGADPWDPEQRGLFLPLDWTRACHALVVDPDVSNTVRTPDSRVAAVCQGGLAPVGIQLAARYPDLVSHLILTSPPVYNDLVTPIPQKELEFNLNFLRTNEAWAFGILETQWAVKTFSNLFLFQNSCDERWLSSCCHRSREMRRALRSPVQVFNAGFLLHRSYEEELTCLVQQPTLILQGEGDVARNDKRAIDFPQKMSNCRVQTLLNCKNVLPWEDPNQLSSVIEKFLLGSDGSPLE